MDPLEEPGEEVKEVEDIDQESYAEDTCLVHLEEDTCLVYLEEDIDRVFFEEDVDVEVFVVFVYEDGKPVVAFVLEAYR